MINRHIRICASTWHQDVHELYDYECQSCTQNSFNTNLGECSLIRNSSIVSLETNPILPEERDSGEIARISQNGATCIEKSKDSDLWLVTKSLDLGYELENDDVIKLGRLKFLSKILTCSSDPSPQFEFTEKCGQSQCKICLSNENSPTNPLISPCDCTGSMELIHLECLSIWIKSRMVKKIYSNKIVCYWKSIDCEICKKTFTSFISLLDLNSHFRKNESILLLEIIEGFKSGIRYVWAVQMMDKDSIVLGRGFDAEIRINDISVSRSHSIIENCKGTFVIKDKKSKFGTLVKKEKYEVVKSTQFQVGRTLISLDFDEENNESLL